MIRRKKRHRYRPKKRFRVLLKQRGFWGGLIFLINILGFFYFLFFSDIFEIKDINILGIQQMISSQEVLSFLRSKTNLQNASFKFFLINSKKIEEEILKNFSEIDSVKIYKKFPNILNIEIKEKEPIAFFCQNNKCKFLDKNGILFEVQKENFDFEKKLIKIESNDNKTYQISERVLEKEDIEKILRLNDIFINDLKFQIKKFILTKEKLIIEIEDGTQFYFDLQKEIDNQILKLKIILEKENLKGELQKIKYIDLRFSRVYIHR